MKKRVTMRRIYNALIEEFGENEGLVVFDKWCEQYGITINDIAPDYVRDTTLGY